MCPVNNSALEPRRENYSEDPEPLEYSLVGYVDCLGRLDNVVAGTRGLLSVDELVVRLDGVGTVLLTVRVERDVQVFDAAVHV